VVTIVQRDERLLPREEPAVSETITEKLHDLDARTLPGSTSSRSPRAATRRPGHRGHRRPIEAQRLLLAAGRQPETANLGLENLGSRGARGRAGRRGRAVPGGRSRSRVGGGRRHRDRPVHAHRGVPGPDRRGEPPRRGRPGRLPCHSPRASTPIRPWPRSGTPNRAHARRDRPAGGDGIDRRHRPRGHRGRPRGLGAAGGRSGPRPARRGHRRRRPGRGVDLGAGPGDPGRGSAAGADRRRSAVSDVQPGAGRPAAPVDAGRRSGLPATVHGSS
jgi:hypothetical protein